MHACIYVSKPINARNGLPLQWQVARGPPTAGPYTTVTGVDAPLVNAAGHAVLPAAPMPPTCAFKAPGRHIPLAMDGAAIYRRRTYITHIHTYTHTYTHTYIHTHIHTYITYTHTYIHTMSYTHTYIHTHTHIHTYIHTCIHTYITHIHTYTHPHTHTHIHTYIPTCIHTYKTYIHYITLH